MANVNGRALMMAIQAVKSIMEGLEMEREEVRGQEDEVDVVELLLSYSNTASDLKRAYQEELQHVDNLPSYESLIKRE